MDHYEIITKLIGKIDPIGESNTDEQRFENLKTTINLIDKLIQDVNRVSFIFKDSHEASVKKIGKYAKNYLDENIRL